MGQANNIVAVAKPNTDPVPQHARAFLDAAWMALTKAEADTLWSALDGAEKDVLMQLRSIRWDGYVSSKTGRDSLVTKGLATRYDGYTAITAHGLILLAQCGRLESLTRGVCTPSGR